MNSVDELMVVQDLNNDTIFMLTCFVVVLACSNALIFTAFYLRVMRFEAWVGDAFYKGLNVDFLIQDNDSKTFMMYQAQLGPMLLAILRRLQDPANNKSIMLPGDDEEALNTEANLDILLGSAALPVTKNLSEIE